MKSLSILLRKVLLARQLRKYQAIVGIPEPLINYARPDAVKLRAAINATLDELEVIDADCPRERL